MALSQHRKFPRRSRPVLVALFSLAAAGFAAADEWRSFDFTGHEPAEGVTAVTPTDVYGDERAWGFEPDFPVAAEAGGITGENGFFFSVALPEGSWKVTVQLAGAPGGSRTTVKAELRRLMVEALPLAENEIATRTFVVNVRNPVIPGGDGIPEGRVRLKSREQGQEAWAWDERLTLEFSGVRPILRTLTIEPAAVPTIFLLGDSTVCDQSREPYTSWGQMLTRFFGPGVAIASHAESGESARDTISERRLDKVLTLLQPGDWVLLQFGHNDQKQIAAGTGSPLTYKDEIRRCVFAVKSAGGIPVVVSPMERRRFDESGRIMPSLADYAQAAQEAARESGAGFIDLHAMSIPLYEAMGPERSLAAFAAPGGKLDETHHAAYGAYELARCVATAARTLRLGFADFLAPDFKDFDPNDPDDPAAFAVPPSPLVTSIRPLGD